MGTITFTKVENNESGDAIRGVYKYDKSSDTYTLQTNTASMDLFSDSAIVGDALIFRTRYDQALMNRLIFNIGTAMAGTYTLKWYAGSKTTKKNTGAHDSIEWVDITSLITDGTNNFTNTGVNEVELNAHDLLVHGYFNPITTNGRDKWIKVEIDTLTSITEGGALSTDRIIFGTNSCSIQGSYIEGTISSLSDNTGLNDTTLNPFTNDTVGRCVWLPDSNDIWNKLPIRDVASSSRINYGIPYPLSPSPCTFSTDSDNPPTAGDNYIIGYVMEDLKNACESAGYDWIKGHGWNPLRKEYNHYICNCNITLNNNGTTGYTFLSALSQRISFYGNYGFSCSTSYLDYNKFMFGTRMWGYKEGESKQQPIDTIPAYGCTIDVLTNGVNGRTFYLSGEFVGTTFTTGCRYSFVTYFDLRYCNIYNCIFENCQLSSGLGCEGLQLSHSPVAEPLRNPSTTFNIKQFRAGGPAIYATSAGNYTLDSPASSDSLPFRTYSGFQTGSSCKVIDKDENTRYGINWGGFVDPTGIFEFWVRTLFNILEKDSVTPIQNASIKVYDNTDTLVINETTDSLGQIGYDGTLMVKEREGIHTTAGAASATDWTYYNPFRIVISKQGYETIDFEMDFLKKQELTFELKQAIDTMIVLGKGIVIRADPTNSTQDRDLLI